MTGSRDGKGDMHLVLPQLIARDRMASRLREAELNRLARVASIHSRQHALARRAEVAARSASNCMGA